MEYRDIKKLNQSILKKILISPKEYLKAKEKQENGEVFTPMEIIYQMLDKLDKNYSKE